MKILVDANIIISALIKDSKVREIFTFCFSNFYFHSILILMTKGFEADQHKL